MRKGNPFKQKLEQMERGGEAPPARLTQIMLGSFGTQGAASPQRGEIEGVLWPTSPPSPTAKLPRGSRVQPSLREYAKAEERLKESIWLRCNGLPLHDYSGRQDDLRTIKAYHAAHGIPPEGFFKRLVWRLRGGR